MAAPSVVSVSPNDGDVGVLLGEPVTVLFDQEVDLDTLTRQGSLVISENVYRVVKTGAKPMEYDEQFDPDYLYSTGYKGIIGGAITTRKVNLTDLDTYEGHDTEGDGTLWRTEATFTPTQVMSASTQFSVLINNTISTRTIFDVVETKTGTGSIAPIGPYTGPITDTYYIKITTAGNRNSGKFTWWTEHYPTHSSPIDISKYPIALSNKGVQVQFERGDYEVDDEFSFIVKAGETPIYRYAWSFTTGVTNTIAPEAPSTKLIGSAIEASVDMVNTDFYIDHITPEHGAANQPLDTTQVVFTFSDDIDETTITDETVFCEGLLANGYWSDSLPIPNGISAMGTINANLVVSGKVLVVEFDLGSGGTLNGNNEIRIWLSNEVKSKSGSRLGNYLYYFTTRYYPIYCDISQVYAKIGNIIGTDFPEDIIYRLLLRYSILSDLFNPSIYVANSYRWKLIRNEWILCNTDRDLLLNIPALAGTTDGRKRLGDLSIQYANGADSQLLKTTFECVDKLTKEIMWGMNHNVLVANKGSRDPDTPNVGRGVGNQTLPGYPIVNSTYQYLMPGTQYTTTHWMRKMMGNYRTNLFNSYAFPGTYRTDSCTSASGNLYGNSPSPIWGNAPSPVLRLKCI